MKLTDILFDLSTRLCLPEDKDWAKAMRNEYAYEPSARFALGAFWAMGTRRLSRERYEPLGRAALGSYALIWMGIKFYAVILFALRPDKNISLMAVDYGALITVGLIYAITAFAIVTRKWTLTKIAILTALAVHVAQLVIAATAHAQQADAIRPITELRLALVAEDILAWGVVLMATGGLWIWQRKNACLRRE